MAKDPAFLFYPGDWQGGTMTLSRHLKGCYMDLLVAQFNSGPLSLEEIKIVLGADFGSSWPTLSKKFKTDGNGLFFNERLEAEKAKRAEYSRKQRERVNKRWNKSGIDAGNTAVLPLENENENEDRKVIGGVGERGKQNFYTNGAEMFDDVKEDPSLVEQLTRVVWNEGYRAVKETHVMLGVKKFCILEEAKGTFRTKPREEFRWHLVNWTRKNAKTISEYAANG